MYNIKFPNRDASLLRNSFVLSQLDGEGMRQMEKQQEMASKEAFKEHILKQVASSNSDNISHHSFRTANEEDIRGQIINDMLERARQAHNNTQFFNIIDTAEAETNTDHFHTAQAGTNIDHFHTAQAGTNTDPEPQQSRRYYIHLSDYLRQVDSLQLEACNNAMEQEAIHEQNLRTVQHEARRELEALQSIAMMRESEQQEQIQRLTAHINTPASYVPQPITDQPDYGRQDHPESQHEPRGRPGRPPAIQQASSSSQAPQQAPSSSRIKTTSTSTPTSTQCGFIR